MSALSLALQDPVSAIIARGKDLKGDSMENSCPQPPSHNFQPSKMAWDYR